ncbi:MAG: hypothetical protein H0T73_06390 [Ardenticatenales bacterium]|nr:hypothetical protein [Ardenticatenales bacterium]
MPIASLTSQERARQITQETARENTRSSIIERGAVLTHAEGVDLISKRTRGDRG